MTDQRTFTAVANIYRRAAESGKPPARAVADELGVPLSTAGYWIRRAKDLGYLSPTAKRNARAVKVAKALGVEYGALVAAVVKHADGDLRVSS